MNISRIIFISLLLISTIAIAKYSNQVSMSKTDNCLTIISNGIPDHKTGAFPNRGNPNSISEQNYDFCVPLNPKKSGQITSVGKDLFGVALNGVIFDPETAEYWNNDRSSEWNFDALNGGINLGIDDNNAHVQPTGAYHYHGFPKDFAFEQESNKQTAHIGFAADGFPIYSCCTEGKNLKSSYAVKEGDRNSGPLGSYDGSYVNDYEYIEGLGDLDECNGMYGVTKEFPDGIYYYVITKEFPNISRCFKGIPDSSFKKKKMGGGRGGMPPHPPMRGMGDRGHPPHGHRPPPPYGHGNLGY